MLPMILCKITICFLKSDMNISIVYECWKWAKKNNIFLQFTIYKIFHWRNTASDNKTMFLMDFTEKYYNTDMKSFLTA